MITVPTVLILGAGASMDFGFPSGTGLIEGILKSTNPDGDGRARGQLIELGFKVDQINRFHSQLSQAAMPSIDDFLEHNHEFIRIGKTAIAQTLVRYERPEVLFRLENNWYKYLFGKMMTEFAAFKNNRLSVITFNYDRSLEHFLFTTLKNSFGKDDAAVTEALRSIPIIHFYGRLGYLPWQTQHDSREYHRNNDIRAIDTASLFITVIHEAEGQVSEKVTQARKALHEAERIVFLGFGYHRTNLERLALPKYQPSIRLRIYGSCFEKTILECNEINDWFKRDRGITQPLLDGIFLGKPEWKNLQFLRVRLQKGHHPTARGIHAL